MGHLERGEKNVSFGSILRVVNALNMTLSEFFSGLESGEAGISKGEAGVGSRHRQNVSVQAGLDWDRLSKEIAALERSVRKLKEIALAEDGRAQEPARSGKRKPSNLRPSGKA